MKFNLPALTARTAVAGIVVAAVATGGCFVYGTRGAYATRYGTATYAAPAQPVMVTASPYAQPIGQGTSTAGSLDPNDPRNERGAAFDDYVIQLTAGVPVTITTIGGAAYDGSSQLDVYTYLYYNGSEIARDDDGAGYPNSRISIMPPYSGTYIIRVSTFGQGLRMGQYQLVVQ